MDDPGFKRSFSVYKVDLETPADQVELCAYLVESTAPINLDDDDCGDGAECVPEGTSEVPDGIDKIVEKLKDSRNPNLVVNVHGFNCPREDIFRRYLRSYRMVCEINPSATAIPYASATGGLPRKSRIRW
jgi:hypothetical protein